MHHAIPSTMRAVVLDRFGGPDALRLGTIAVPTLGPDDVLIRVASAGVGEWDAFERAGGYAAMLDMPPTFPYVLGSEGAGTVVAVGEHVRRFTAGDQVYALGFLNPKGGFYAEYAAVDAALVAVLPSRLTSDQAAVMSGVGTTAVRGLDDTLGLKAGETVIIVGASGGVGHLAVQLATRMGTRVVAVASGDDGVALVRSLGAAVAINGRTEDVLAAAQAFAPSGIDAALLTVGGAVAEQALAALRAGGRAAFPKGVQPEPQARAGLALSSYYGAPDHDIIARLNGWIEAGPFRTHIAHSYALEQAADAHRALEAHYLGKLALRVV